MLVLVVAFVTLCLVRLPITSVLSSPINGDCSDPSIFLSFVGGNKSHVAWDRIYSNNFDSRVENESELNFQFYCRNSFQVQITFKQSSSTCRLNTEDVQFSCETKNNTSAKNKIEYKFNQTAIERVECVPTTCTISAASSRVRLRLRSPNGLMANDVAKFEFEDEHVAFIIPNGRLIFPLSRGESSQIARTELSCPNLSSSEQETVLETASNLTNQSIITVKVEFQAAKLKLNSTLIRQHHTADVIVINVTSSSRYLANETTTVMPVVANETKLRNLSKSEMKSPIEHNFTTLALPANSTTTAQSTSSTVDNEPKLENSTAVTLSTAPKNATEEYEDGTTTQGFAASYYLDDVPVAKKKRSADMTRTFEIRYKTEARVECHDGCEPKLPTWSRCASDSVLDLAYHACECSAKIQNDTQRRRANKNSPNHLLEVLPWILCLLYGIGAALTIFAFERRLCRRSNEAVVVTIE